jgi:hypothetical protein
MSKVLIRKRVLDSNIAIVMLGLPGCMPESYCICNSERAARGYVRSELRDFKDSLWSSYDTAREVREAFENESSEYEIAVNPVREVLAMNHVDPEDIPADQRATKAGIVDYLNQSVYS